MNTMVLRKALICVNCVNVFKAKLQLVKFESLDKTTQLLYSIYAL